jgi:hypothetical protein
MTKVYSVKASNQDTELLPPSVNRKGAVIYNNANMYMYVKLGTGASLVEFSTILAPRSHWEIPSGHIGSVNAVWFEGATGDAKVSDIQ